jgi:environmental stress-induced protein Ves
MPWRNGGGTTTEITIAPEGAAVSGERFVHRVSIADVEVDGPFSRFQGYDRHIMLLEGAGMTLECGAHGSIELRPFEPRSFSGDWEVNGRLVGGPVRDFNVIVDRVRAAATVAVRLLSAPETMVVTSGETCIVHVISGDVGHAAAGDTIVADAAFTLEPRLPARVAIARVVAR